MGNRTVSVTLAARVQEYMARLGQAKQATGKLLGEIDKLGKESPEKFNRIAFGIGATGAALLGVAGMAVKTAMEFDKQMSAVGAVADATAGDMEHLRQAALDAGKATVFSATEAAKAEEELAKAGIKTTDILTGGLSGALDLASAGQMDLADAATIAAQAMNIFGLRGSAVPHIADVLAAASNKSAASMKDLGDALKQGGLLANQAGLSLEETTGTLAAFADRALIGSDAGTSLKTMLQMLAGPSEKSAKLMRSLGIEVYDAAGQFIGITRLAGVLQTKLSGLTQAQRDAAMAQIFGSDATRAANVLYTLGEKGLQGYIDAVNDTGAAQDVAAKKTDNLAGDLERLKGTLSNVAIEAGSGASGGLRSLVKTADALVSAFGDLPAPIQSTATVLAAVGGASLLATAGLLKARQTVSEMMDVLTNMGPTGAKAAEGLRTLAGVGGRLGIVGLAVGGIWFGLNELSDWAARKHAPLKADIDKLTSSLENFAATGIVVGELAEKYGQNLEKIRKDAVDVSKGIKQLNAYLAETKDQVSSEWGEALDRDAFIDPQAEQRVKDLDTALAQMVSNGHAVQAALFMEQLRASGTLTAQEFASLQTLLPNYTQAAGEANTANSALGKGFADASTQASILSGSLSEAIEKGQTLTDVWNVLHGAMLSADKAMLDANKAVEAATKAFDENGKVIAGNSTKALENRVALQEVAKSAAAAAEAKLTETGSIEQANAVYRSYADQLKNSLRQAGLLTDGVSKLIDQIFAMPPTYTTTIKTPGLPTAVNQASRVNRELDRLDGRTVRATILLEQEYHREQARERRWGGVTTHAASGTLRDASVYSTASPARYAFAEPATGGEAFVPRRGNYGRSMSILSTAAAWYGASVQPYGTRAMGTSTQIVEHRHTLVVEGTGVMSSLRKEIKFSGGNVQQVLGFGAS